MKRKTLVIILIIFFGLIGIKALFHPGFYTNHDGEHQVIRLYHFDQSLKDGQVSPRWAGTADNGYGYPLFIFSYQSPWFIGVPLLKLGLSLTDAVKGVFVIGFIISGITMLLWLSQMLGTLPGLVGAFLYLWAPFRFSNIFVRASLGEATAYLFIPLVFWGIWRSIHHKKSMILISIGLAGIILSHMMVLIVFSLPIIIWSLIQVWESKQKITVARRIFIGGLFGTGLSAYYFLPAILEMNYTVASQTLQSHFLDHFVTLEQLVYSKWGYGFDFPGSVNDAMSFQVGIGQWLAVGLLCIFIIIDWWRRKKIDIVASFSVGIFLFSILMMIPISKPIWEFMVKYAYFDFPWRYLGLAVFSGSLAAAILISKLGKLGWIFTFVFFIIAFYTNRNHLNVNQYIYNNDSYYSANLQTTNMYDEYRPKTINSEYLKQKRNRFEYDKKEIIVNQLISKSNYLKVEGQANQQTKSIINISYYPGWNIWLNKVKQPKSVNGDGVMEVILPKGKFDLQVIFQNTLLRTISNIISLISVSLIVIWLIPKNKTFSKN
ncbi:MAG: hypothetical protein V1858_03990 [Candidatus Gottesmanbacteria bacterium]